MSFNVLVNNCDLPTPLKCRVYNEISKYYFLRSEYQAAYTWSIKALMELEVGNCSPRLVVDILRQVPIITQQLILYIALYAFIVIKVF